MRIVVDAMVLWGRNRYSGVERVVDHLCRRMLHNSRGHEVRVCVPSDWPGFEEDHLATENGQIHDCEAMRPAPSIGDENTSSVVPGPFSGRRRLRRIFWQQFELPGLLRRWNADAVFCPAYVMPLQTPCPAVAFVHDLHGLQLSHTRLANYLHYRMLLPLTLRRAAGVITPTTTVLDAVKPRLGAGTRIAVAPLGIGPAFTPSAAGTNVLPDNLPTDPFILYVGNLERRKNLHLLLEAMAQLPAGLSGIRLVLVGKDQGMQDGIEQAILASGLEDRVSLTGFVAERRLVDLYRRASIVALPSVAEGFGLTPLEAMACGAPVVATATPAALENLQGAAEICPPDSGALAAALARVLTDPVRRSQLIAAGLERAAQFTWEQTTESVWRMLECLTKHASG